MVEGMSLTMILSHFPKLLWTTDCPMRITLLAPCACISARRGPTLLTIINPSVLLKKIVAFL